MTPKTRIEPVRRLKLSDSVAADLERMIMRGDYAVGDRLAPERELAAQFGVGRSSMREALRLVEAAGLVRIDHGVGVFIASQTKTPVVPAASELLVLDGVTVPELFEVRLSLESDAAANAARRITPDEAAVLRRLIAAADDGDLDNGEFVRLDAELHRTIVRATKNALLMRVFESIEPIFLSYSDRVIGLAGRRETAHEGHEAIVEAIIGRRAREAREAMVRHLRKVERDIVEHLERPAEGSPGGTS